MEPNLVRMHQFIKSLPKLELHAHLNGSLDIDALRELGGMVYGERSSEFRQLCDDFNTFDSLNDCFRTFKFVHDLTKTRQGLRHATLMVIRNFAQDNVVYLELRTTPKKTEEMTKRSYLRCVLSAIEEGSSMYSGILVKLLPSIDRSQGLAEALDTVDMVHTMRRLYPGIIVGLDFSGNPNLGRFSEYRPLLSMARKTGLKMALHCGEVENPEEIEEMINFGMDRCGHGTFLTDAQVKRLHEQNTAIECCLTSNVKCKTVASYEDHHFKRLHQAQFPIVLCTDDSGIFKTTLTKEMMHAAKTFSLNKNDILWLSSNAITHAFAQPAEKHDIRLRLSIYSLKEKF